MLSDILVLVHRKSAHVALAKDLFELIIAEKVRLLVGILQVVLLDMLPHVLNDAWP